MIQREHTGSIGSMIYEARKEKGLSLEDVGRAIGATKATISRYERGVIENIGLSKIPDLCRVLGVTPNQLFMWEYKEPVNVFSEMKRCENAIKKTPSFSVYGRKEWNKFSKAHSVTTLTGYLYLVQIGDLVKIGKSIFPYGRVINLKVTFENYGNEQIGLCAISEEHKNYTENERLLHQHFKNNRIVGTELFKLDFQRALKEIENGWTGIKVS